MFTVISKDIQADTYGVETQPCIVCNKVSYLDIPTQGMFWYNQGKLIQDCFPELSIGCLLYTSPSPRDRTRSRMPSSA